MNYFYKNLFFYNVKETVKEQEIEDLLSDKVIKECGKHELKTQGWTNVLKDTEELVQKVDGAYFFKYKIVEKVIPSSVLNDLLEEKVKKIEKIESRKVFNKEKKAIKEDIQIEMASKAFERSSYINGYIDFKNKLLIVETSSPSKADEFTSFLRETLGKLSLEIIPSKYDVVEKLTSLISNPPSKKFELGESCLLKDMLGTNAKVTISNQELDVEEVINHISNGKSVDSLELIWQKRISFVLTSDYKIRKVKFLDIVTTQLNEDLGESDDDFSNFLSSMTIMLGDFNEMIEDLNSL